MRQARGVRGFLTIVPAVAVAILLSSGAALGAPGWTTPAMIWDGDYSSPSMAVDSHGHVHVAARGDTGIWYLTNKSGHWTRVRLTTDIATSDGNILGEHPQIGRDPSDGSLTVVYLRVDSTSVPSGAELRYVTNRSGAWSPPRSIPATGHMGVPSVVVRHGVIAVASGSGFGDETGTTTVEFITNASGHWTHAFLGPERVNGPEQPSLALDSHGKPRIAYLQGGLVRYARGTTTIGSFVKETVYTIDRSVAPSLTLDADGHPRVAFASDFAYRDGSGWHPDALPMLSDVRLTSDGHGKPSLLMAQESNGLSYWHWASLSGDPTSVVLDTHSVSVLGGIATGPSGRIYVVYQRGGANPRIWFSHTN